jgi:peptidoglycan hydrolase-like protein with peptidoglycan-binding domain
MQTHTVERAPTRGSQPASPLRTARTESHAAGAPPVGMGNQAAQRLLRTGVIQPKLTVNQPGDRFEQEADRVASEVMRMPDSQGTRRPPQIQRLCAECEEDLHRVELEKEEEEKFFQAKAVPGHTLQVSPQVEAHIEGLRGGGQQLPTCIRNFFEPRFGRDFSSVRLHTGAGAAESARAVNARAYTVGKNIVLGAGELAPETNTGRSLLAHELVHTIQQAGSSEAPATRLQRTIGDDHDLKAPRFSGTRNVELEAAFDNELLIDVERHRRGAHVRLIQESLLAQGYTLPGFRADGIFGPETKAAIIRFQRDAGAVNIDGIVGPETMGLLDTHDPSLHTGVGPVAITGPVPGPRPAPAPVCDRPYTGVTFALEDQAGKGVSPAALIRILQDTKDRYYLEMRGMSSVKYRPEVTITAPDDPTAKQFQVGFIQNLLSVFRSAYYDNGSRVDTNVPTLPMKDGQSLSSGKYDPVFMSSQTPDVERFIDGDAALTFEDIPRASAYISLLDNSSCVSQPLPASMHRMVMYDEFRTWLAVRHKPTGCVRALHHIDWNLVWDANVTMRGNDPVLTVLSNVSKVTVANGDGRPGFIQGGRVAKEIAHQICI